MSDNASGLFVPLDGVAVPDLWDRIVASPGSVTQVPTDGVSVSQVDHRRQRRVFDRGGVELSFLVTDGLETPIVFVHGLTSAAVTWEPVMDRLDRGALYALDLRGCGQSDRSVEYGLHLDADDVVAFLEHVSGPAVLVAHSRGALVAFLATFKRPDLVLGVFSEDMTPAFWENPRMWQLPFMKMLLAWGAVVREFSTEGRDREWMEQHLAEVEFGDTSTVGELVGPGAVVQWANEATNCDPAVLLVENLVEIGDPTAAEMMASVSGPFHVAYGDVETGGTVEPYEIELLRTHAQRPSATRFPGQSHMIHLTDPDGMVGDLDQWLTTNQF